MDNVDKIDNFINMPSLRNLRFKSVLVLSYGLYCRLVVGAPRGNSTSRGDRDIYQPGVVYQCSVDKRGKCQNIVFDIWGEYLKIISLK
jgi:hypothetical protein